MVKKTQTVVAKYVSSRDPGKVYQVKQDEQGTLSCNCLGWIYRRTCKHVADAARTLREGFVELTDIPTYSEMQQMLNDPEEERRWIEAHLKPKTLFGAQRRTTPCTPR